MSNIHRRTKNNILFSTLQNVLDTSIRAVMKDVVGPRYRLHGEYPMPSRRDVFEALSPAMYIDYGRVKWQIPFYNITVDLTAENYLRNQFDCADIFAICMYIGQQITTFHKPIELLKKMVGILRSRLLRLQKNLGLPYVSWDPKLFTHKNGSVVRLIKIAYTNNFTIAKHK